MDPKQEPGPAETDPREAAEMTELEEMYERHGVEDPPELEVMEIDVDQAWNQYEEEPSSDALKTVLELCTNLFQATTSSDPFQKSHNSQITKVDALIDRVYSILSKGYRGDNIHALEKLFKLLHKELNK